MSERATSEHCKWWKQPWQGVSHDDHDVPDGFGVCDLTRTQYRAFGWNGYWSHPDTLAIASGADDSSHYLWTAADFGCVQWHAKEPA